MKLTREQANEVWDLLLSYGAMERSRDSFVSYLIHEIDHHEYRFCGIFRGGGKVRLSSYYGLLADYYQENRTPELDMKMHELCSELRALSVKFNLIEA
jgi:uncharacterized UPF0160 family protein